MSNLDMNASESIPMFPYVGTKIVLARPMTRGEYNTYRGWTIPENENPEDAGFLVEYPGTTPDVEGHAGYISWSPKAVFDGSHVSIRGDVIVSHETVRFFEYAHLPPHLQGVSKLFSLLAQQMDTLVADNDQKNIGMQKLLEAKDCFVRANIPKK